MEVVFKPIVMIQRLKKIDKASLVLQALIEVLYVVKCSLYSLHSRRRRDSEDKMFGQEEGKGG